MRIVAGSAKGRKLKSPNGNDIRPTSDKVREALFDILGSEINNANFLDLFAGSGGIGLEALSRGANVTMVEKNPAALALLRSNIAHCGFEKNFQVVATDSLRFIKQLVKSPPVPPFDIIFADPPYDSALVDQLLAELQTHILTAAGLLIIEHRKSKKLAESSNLWEKKREAVYGKTVLSFYQRIAP